MIVQQILSDQEAIDALPVFEGLEGSSVSGKDIAAIVGVTPPTISKWRRGRARVPAAKLVFLTMLLAAWVEEVEDLRRIDAGWGEGWLDEHLEEVRRCLKEQEDYNCRLPPAAVREGVGLFRSWWSGSAGGLRCSGLGLSADLMRRELA